MPPTDGFQCVPVFAGDPSNTTQVTAAAGSTCVFPRMLGEDGLCSTTFCRHAGTHHDVLVVVLAVVAALALVRALWRLCGGIFHAAQSHRARHGASDRSGSGRTGSGRSGLSARTHGTSGRSASRSNAWGASTGGSGASRGIASGRSTKVRPSGSGRSSVASVTLAAAAQVTVGAVRGTPQTSVRMDEARLPAPAGRRVGRWWGVCGNNGDGAASKPCTWSLRKRCGWWLCIRLDARVHCMVSAAMVTALLACGDLLSHCDVYPAALSQAWFHGAATLSVAAIAAVQLEWLRVAHAGSTSAARFARVAESQTRCQRAVVAMVRCATCRACVSSRVYPRPLFLQHRRMSRASKAALAISAVFACAMVALVVLEYTVSHSVVAVRASDVAGGTTLVTLDAAGAVWGPARAWGHAAVGACFAFAGATALVLGFIVFRLVERTTKLVPLRPARGSVSARLRGAVASVPTALARRVSRLRRPKRGGSGRGTPMHAPVDEGAATPDSLVSPGHGQVAVEMTHTPPQTAAMILRQNMMRQKRQVKPQARRAVPGASPPRSFRGHDVRSKSGTPTSSPRAFRRMASMGKINTRVRELRIDTASRSSPQLGLRRHASDESPRHTAEVRKARFWTASGTATNSRGTPQQLRVRLGSNGSLPGAVAEARSPSDLDDVSPGTPQTGSFSRAQSGIWEPVHERGESQSTSSSSSSSRASSRGSDDECSVSGQASVAVGRSRSPSHDNEYGARSSESDYSPRSNRSELSPRTANSNADANAAPAAAIHALASPSGLPSVRTGGDDSGTRDGAAHMWLRRGSLPSGSASRAKMSPSSPSRSESPLQRPTRESSETAARSGSPAPTRKGRRVAAKLRVDTDPSVPASPGRVTPQTPDPQRPLEVEDLGEGEGMQSPSATRANNVHRSSPRSSVAGYMSAAGATTTPGRHVPVTPLPHAAGTPVGTASGSRRLSVLSMFVPGGWRRASVGVASVAGAQSRAPSRPGSPGADDASVADTVSVFSFAGTGTGRGDSTASVVASLFGSRPEGESVGGSGRTSALGSRAAPSAGAAGLPPRIPASLRRPSNSSMAAVRGHTIMKSPTRRNRGPAQPMGLFVGASAASLRSMHGRQPGSGVMGGGTGCCGRTSGAGAKIILSTVLVATICVAYAVAYLLVAVPLLSRDGGCEYIMDAPSAELAGQHAVWMVHVVGMALLMWLFPRKKQRTDKTRATSWHTTATAPSQSPWRLPNAVMRAWAALRRSLSRKAGDSGDGTAHPHAVALKQRGQGSDGELRVGASAAP